MLAEVVVCVCIRLLVRKTKSAHWLQMQVVYVTQSILIWLPLLIFVNELWINPDLWGWGEWDLSLYTVVVMLLLGIFGFFGVMLSVIGYQIGDATKVAWMEYLDLVFAFLYQWLYFKEVPDIWEVIGFCALVSTCFIHLAEESYNYRQAAKVKEKKKECEYEVEDSSL